MALTGKCRCGAVQYMVTVDKIPPTYACHCTICQRVSGSSFAHQMPVPEGALTLTGELVSAALTTLSGSLSTQYHCAKCLTRIYNTNTARPGIAIIRAGTLDDSPTLAPAFHIYVSTKQSWIELPEGIPTFAEAATPDALLKLLNGS